MKELANAILKSEKNSTDKSVYYFTVSVDETSEDRETAKEEYPISVRVDRQFGCASVYFDAETCQRVAVRFLRKWRDYALGNGYESVGDIVEELDGEFCSWAYADFTHNGKPIRLRAELEVL